MNQIKHPEIPFPFVPYDIQRQLMQAIYKALDDKAIAIMESPTGTGKSLSVACAGIQWLRDHAHEPLEEEQKEIETEKSNAFSSSLPSWVFEQHEQMQKREQNSRQQDYVSARNRVKELLKASARKKIGDGGVGTRNRSRRRIEESNAQPARESPFTYVPNQDFNSEDDDEISKACGRDSSDSEVGEHGHMDAVSEFKERKIIFCSRTHSQLSQFVGEVRRTQYAADLRCVTLASRSMYCVNPEVRKLSNAEAMADRCLELMDQKKKKPKGSGGCGFNSELSRVDLRNQVLNQVQDIEDVLESAHGCNGCPYYSTRAAISAAELVLVPYNMVFHRPTRESVGLDLRGHVVVVDEAHNLIEAINGMHGVKLSNNDLEQAKKSLHLYIDRFQNYFKAKTLLRLRQFLYTIEQFLRITRVDSEDNVEPETILGLGDFGFKSRINHMELDRLEKFFQKSQVLEKLQWYIEQELNSDTGEPLNQDRFLFSRIRSFLKHLHDNERDGRVMVRRSDEPQIEVLRFWLLNPSSAFREVADQARAVILIGGTMKPLKFLQTQLFGGDVTRAPDLYARLQTFSCGHVVPANQLVVLPVARGPSGESLCFSYANRNSDGQLRQLGTILVTICSAIRGGIIVFFPSFAFLSQAENFLRAQGVVERISRQKAVFVEPRSAAELESVLERYRQFACKPPDKKNGAVMLGVCGGKMSEGINFQDDLGRCVIVVGMPYPNTHDPITQAQMQYLIPGNRQGASEYLDTVCMRSVNQSIGRVIRHIRDYSAVLLLDERYSKPAIQELLPDWMRASVPGPALTFLETMKSLRTFTESISHSGK